MYKSIAISNVHIIIHKYTSNLPKDPTGSDLNPISLAVIVLNLLFIHIVLLTWDGIIDVVIGEVGGDVRREKLLCDVLLSFS